MTEIPIIETSLKVKKKLLVSLVSLYTPWKCQKTSGILMLLGGIERDKGQDTS